MTAARPTPNRFESLSEVLLPALRQAPEGERTSDNNGNAQSLYPDLADDAGDSVEFAALQNVLCTLTMTRSQAMQLAADLIDQMDDPRGRKDPAFKTAVLKWLDQNTIRVLPPAAKDSLFF